MLVYRTGRVALWFGILTISSAVFTKAPGASIPLQTVQAQGTGIIHRPTSRPYTGDLSVFEDLKRDKKLQVNRVMDLLQIHAESTVADIGDHGVNRDVVIDEVKRAGFVLAADYDFVKPDGADYFLIFRPSLTATE